MQPSGSKREEVKLQLPHAQPLHDPQRDPFVGNDTVDDNICEWAWLAIWNALPGAHSNVTVSVADGTATLSGVAQSLAERQAITAAVEKVQGVTRTIDRLRVARPRSTRAQLPAQPAALAIEHLVARPMLYVVRHCVLDESSISAAMRQAVPMLEEALAAHGALPMSELIVIYRNRIPGAVTVEIGVPIDLPPGAVTRSEPALGQSPGGPVLSQVADAGLPGLLRREAELVATAHAAGLEAGSFFWQSFDYDQTHPWTAHPEARVFLPVVPTPALSQIAPSGASL